MLAISDSWSSESSFTAAGSKYTIFLLIVARAGLLCQNEIKR